MELFEAANKDRFLPLAARMRPRRLEEFIGQSHILGPGRLLRRAIQLDQLSSLIFWGPPGTGKTTLARVIANTTKSHFITLNAVLAGVAELREVVGEANQKKSLYQMRTILFVDEVHRWNKIQQDALLPWVENGTIIFIGATTENPFFKVNTALLSRSRVFQLKRLTHDELKLVALAALSDYERGYGKYKIVIDEDALEHLIKIADGDARSLLNALELAVETTPGHFPPQADEEIRITLAIAEESIQRKAVLYDREGDYHYDTISAFIKSLRGSDPDAAFYWLARMVAAGEDPAFIFRRMLIFACEDVGLADPQALIFVQAAAQAFEQVGLPEGRFHLAQAALYLACAPKSNSVMGFFDALKLVTDETQADVPAHLKDPSRDAEDLGHGQGYLYPHAFRDHWVSQQYLPPSLAGRIFYQPSDIGQEAIIKERIERYREAQLESLDPGGEGENYVFLPEDRDRDIWLKRASLGISSQAEDIRCQIFKAWPQERHLNFVDLKAGTGLLVWEARRRFPAGLTVAITANSAEAEIIRFYAQRLSELERPLILTGPLAHLLAEGLPDELRGIAFEAVACRNLLVDFERPEFVGEVFNALLAKGGRVSLAERLPKDGQRLSDCILAWEEGRRIIERIEERIFKTVSPWSRGRSEVLDFVKKTGLVLIKQELKTYQGERSLSWDLISRWVKLRYEPFLREFLKEYEKNGFVQMLKEKTSGQTVNWKTTVLFLQLTKA